MSFVAQTPMLKQYFQAKSQHPGVLIAMRVGDFYEFYGDDAEAAARTLEITLTGREDGSNGRIAMAGVPYHSVEKYLARLVAAGHKVALCDQIEDPKLAKGLVQRAVTRVLTAGTLIEDSMLAGSNNNFLSAIFLVEGQGGIATLDPSTGEFFVTEILAADITSSLAQELGRLRPAELLIAQKSPLMDRLAELTGPTVTEVSKLDLDRSTQFLLDHFQVANLQGFGCEGKSYAIQAAAMVLGYAVKNGLTLSHVDTISTYSVESFMAIDPSTRRSLELSQNLSDGSRKYTLLSVLDFTITSMGARLLRRWIEQPLLDLDSINARQSAVQRLMEQTIYRADLSDALKQVADLERLVSRCCAGVATPRDVGNLRSSLAALPKLTTPLRKISLGMLQSIAQGIDEHGELALLLNRAIVNDPPLTMKDGGVICDDYDIELDELRKLSRTGRDFIVKIEAAERERTGISTLKVGYNSVFGYYLEVSKQHVAKVPEHYIRKQTTANAERYITTELKEQESAVLGASEKALAVESSLFEAVKNQVKLNAGALLTTARAIAELDVLISFATAALTRGYVRPEVNTDDCLQIVEGRHPVVESNNAQFVPNDLDLAAKGQGTRAIILTGPNMSGKSTYLRQTALICLMAQIGCFVPAKSAKVGLCDRIFARIGAKDELALGQSTFMVEMVECAFILNHATERSLVVLDEVGRGTSTYDGMAIAWSIIERLVEMGSKTMFATHYHQLNILASQLEGVVNFRVSVQEIGDDIVWTHRVLQGGTDRSYGIQVARMAGVPPFVLGRARDILKGLESSEDAPAVSEVNTKRLQMSLFEIEEHDVVRQLRDLELDDLTPRQAMQILDSWKKNL
ncbi:MAG: DNA mismatch repair protein MutS [Armatimonadetes bacterium]|nr:DNA mismatch repair protein MutS [Armatimonadota bacterium]